MKQTSEKLLWKNTGLITHSDTHYLAASILEKHSDIAALIAARFPVVLVDELAAEGKAIILVSSELPELLRCCDRILVLNEGRVTAQFDAMDATQEKIMSAATTTWARSG